MEEREDVRERAKDMGVCMREERSRWRKMWLKLGAVGGEREGKMK